MPKIKTAELKGPPMRWAFFLAEGLTPFLDSYTIPANGLGWGSEPKTVYGATCKEKDFPNLGWSVVGPIIDRERITVGYDDQGGTERGMWGAYRYDGDGSMWFGDSSLTAVLRCYVAFKLGEEVDVPEELVSATLASVLGEGE